MAFQATKERQTVFGDSRVWMGTVTADANSGTIDIGAEYIIAVQATPKSMASAPFSVKRNVLTADTASVGTIAFTGVTSGDDIDLVVYYR